MEISTLCGPVTVNGDFGPWQIRAEAASPEDGVQVVSFALSAPAKSAPPKFVVVFRFPLNDVQMRWTALRGGNCFIPPDWMGKIDTSLAHGIPLLALLSTAGRNRLTFAVSEASRRLEITYGTDEDKVAVRAAIAFFTEPEAPLDRYEFELRLDARDAFYADAIAAAAAWLSSFPQYRPAPVPAAAFAPLYSSWYNFHQDVFAPELEAECARAVELGMKTIIVDDGWQTDDNNRGYAYCGDWEVSPRRFPDMAAHVKKIHALGMKYMVWYSVPFVGFKSKNAERFQGKYLRRDDWLKTYVLDPRFPEVREFLIGTYEKALREWDIDGFKLDFIDSFTLGKEDPAIAENYAGRDYKTVPEGIDALMSAVMERLRAIKPDILVEFRQSYIGPAIRKFGNMIRVGDCPGDALRNRVGALDLRLTSGGTAVHSDMMEFHVSEPAHASALELLNAIFAVPQVSVRLDRITDEQKAMLRFWLQFCVDHAGALLHGSLRPEHPELNYPLVTAADAKETVTAVYAAGFVATAAPGKPHYFVNATDTEELALELPADAKAEIFDCCGRLQPARELCAGFHRLSVPKAGLVALS